MGDERYQEQHKKRLALMPWLYDRLKPAQSWARDWQHAIQQALMEVEDVVIGDNVFIAPDAQLFAEPGRSIRLADNVRIASGSVLHGPITLGQHVSINHHVTMDGGRAGIVVGDHTRIAAYSALYAFNHGFKPDQLIREQPVTSHGIRIGSDVWIGARTGIVDGVSIGDGAVIGMNSTVTRDVEANTVVAGNPARFVKRRD